VGKLAGRVASTKKLYRYQLDGDQMSIKGIFSQEANAECDKIVRSKANILDINASNVRKSENEAIQTLYTLTKRPDIPRQELDDITDPTQYD
jgi:hypothetical protein